MSNLLRYYLDSLNLPQEQGLTQLNALQQKHIELYNFSSFNALGNEVLACDLESVLERVVKYRQGGYCFEHNKIAYYALKALGYEVIPILARVNLNGRKDNARTHRVNLVRWQQKEFLVDVGFGPSTPSQTIDISESRTVSIGAFRYQVIRKGKEVNLMQITPEQLDLYDFSIETVLESDFDVAHFYSHQHPEAVFTSHLMLTNITSDKRHIIKNFEYKSLDEQSGETVALQFDKWQTMRDVIVKHFNLSFDEFEVEQRFKQLEERFLGEPKVA